MPFQKRLRDDFGFELPKIEDVDDFDPEKYFEELGKSIKDFGQWSIDRNGMHLGFFSFSNLLMMRDLEPANWPEEFKEHPVLGRLLLDGFEPTDPLFGAKEKLNPLLAPADLLHVVQADAS